jgi:hypothetical protein
MNIIKEKQMKLTELEKKILIDLHDKAESEHEDYEVAGKIWESVYLGNCKNYGTKSWTGVLSSLTKKGLYRGYDDGENNGIWGEVLKGA